MGSLASKATRKLPKRPEPPAWAGKRTPDENPSAVGREQLKEHRYASEHRTEDIEKDARDPDFLANLNRLGPVRVDHHMKTFQPDKTATAELFKSRQELEHELESSNQHHGQQQQTSNKIHAGTLNELLDKRKGVQSKEEMERVAKQYNVDFEKLERVARFVSSPSIGKDVKKVVDKDGNENVVMKAIWVESAYGHNSSTSTTA